MSSGYLNDGVQGVVWCPDPSEWHTAPLVVGTHRVVSPVPEDRLDRARTLGTRLVEDYYRYHLLRTAQDDYDLETLREVLSSYYTVRWRPVRDLRLVRLAMAEGHASAAAVRARVAFYGGRCWICGGEANSIDHVKPLARGGSKWPANLRPACRSCNSKKGQRWPYALAEAA